MEPPLVPDNASLQATIQQVRAELDKAAAGPSVRFVKLCRWRPFKIAAETIQPPLRSKANDGTTPTTKPSGESGFAYICLLEAFERWSRQVADGVHRRPADVAGAVEWIWKVAWGIKKREYRRSGGPAATLGGQNATVFTAGGPTELAALRAMSIRESKTRRDLWPGQPTEPPSLNSRTNSKGKTKRPGKPGIETFNHPTQPKGKSNRLGKPGIETTNQRARGRAAGAGASDVYGPMTDARAPSWAVFLWAVSETSRRRHVFNFNSLMGVVSGKVGRLVAQGIEVPRAVELIRAEYPMRDVPRYWRDGAFKVRQMLYIIGSLGPLGAFRSPAYLDAAVEQLDAAFKGDWKSVDLALLKAITANSQATDDGFAIMTATRLSQFLEDRAPKKTRLQNTAMECLKRLTPAGSECSPLTLVHNSESLVAKRSSRPNADCIYGYRCPTHGRLANQTKADAHG